MAGRVVHFEIHAENLERAAEFYKDVFGWKVWKWDGPDEYWLIKTGDPEEPGYDGGLMKRIGHTPADHIPVTSFVSTIAVENIDEALELVKKHGGAQINPKNEIPGVGWHAYAKDTENNCFGMIQVTGC
jgi:predicted enzyme related to lactoylglutathione lyase